MKKLIKYIFLFIVLQSCSSKKEKETLNQLVIFTLKPELSKSFKQAALKSKTASILEPGNIEMKLYTDAKNENKMYVYSRWKNKEAYATHITKSYTKNLQKLAKEAVQSVNIMKLEETAIKPNHNLKQVNTEDKEETVFFIFKIKKEFRTEVLTQFKKHITATNKEAGNLFFDIYTIENNVDTFVVYENWRNKSALWDIHMRAPYSLETGELLNKALVGKFEDYLNFAVELK